MMRLVSVTTTTGRWLRVPETLAAAHCVRHGDIVGAGTEAALRVSAAIVGRSHSKKEKSLPDIDARLRALVAEHLGIDPELVVPDAHLASDLNADSLDLIEIMLAAEDTFGIQLSDDAMEAARTYGDLLRAVAPTPTGAVQ